jgi:hypothetical protein
MATFLVPKSSKKFCCESCDYNTSRLSQYERHISTPKHLNTTFRLQNATCLVPKVPNIEKVYICSNCNKEYKHHSSLSKHKALCNNINASEIDNNSSNEIIQEKNELIQYLINENKEFKNLILEIVKKDNNNISNNINNNCNNTINSNNKSFNLQFFLNETCKDAMNMSEFIDSMKLQLSDLESVGKLGFVDGISSIIIKNLEALDVQKRPVHCSDSKRETVYIKEHDKWEKDDSELKQMKELVRTVRDKNITLIATWRDLYPECVQSNSRKTTQFNQICMEAFGGETGGEKGTKQEKEEKIISKIAKSVIIDKHE